ncbi:MAG: hypothetical protein ACHBN1_10885 [Heteroscytonema crispum UTEX LB 1556]
MVSRRFGAWLVEKQPTTNNQQSTTDNQQPTKQNFIGGEARLRD